MARKLTQGPLVAGVRCLMSVMEYAALRTVIPGEWGLQIQLDFCVTSIYVYASIWHEPSTLAHVAVHVWKLPPDVAGAHPAVRGGAASAWAPSYAVLDFASGLARGG